MTKSAKRASRSSKKKTGKRAAKAGCEFCRQPSNRPDGAYTCPYCGKVWA